jgi:hypothetical protein
MWTRYVKLPELSVEGFQANVTLVAVLAVVCRLVGCVGGVWSLAAKAGVVPKSDTSVTTTSATLTARQRGTFLIMLYLQSSHKKEALQPPRGCLYLYIRMGCFVGLVKVFEFQPRAG